jgi:benzoyl-CoA-dihydrodiol lyase
VLRTGDPRRCSRWTRRCAHKDHWLVREIIALHPRTLKRMDLTARSFFALIEPGNCLRGHAVRAGARADRPTCSTIPDEPNTIALSVMNAGFCR